MVMMGTTTWTTKLTKTERRRLKRLSSFCLCGELPQLLDCTSNYSCTLPRTAFLSYIYLLPLSYGFSLYLKLWPSSGLCMLCAGLNCILSLVPQASYI